MEPITSREGGTSGTTATQEYVYKGANRRPRLLTGKGGIGNNDGASPAPPRRTRQHVSKRGPQ